MVTKSAIQIDVAQVSGLADKVAKLDAESFAQAAVTALNDAAESGYELARDRITVGINISDDYLRHRMSLNPATRTTLKAEIVASGDVSRMTRLVHYDARMVIVPAKTKRPQNRGRLGIPVGSKQAGVSVHVKTPKTIDGWFMLPLRQGNAQGEKLGVFSRKNGRLKHMYGPSVYQLFRYQIPHIEGEVGEGLQEEMLRQVDIEVRKVFE